jgi:hypothetical protein
MGGPPYRNKLQTYLELRPDLERRCPAAEYFDLRFRDRIFVKEAHSALTPPAPVPSSVPAEKAGPEDAVIPQDRSPQDRSLPNQSPDPDPLPPLTPDAQGDAAGQSPAESTEVVTG